MDDDEALGAPVLHWSEGHKYALRIGNVLAENRFGVELFVLVVAYKGMHSCVCLQRPRAEQYAEVERESCGNWKICFSSRSIFAASD